MDSSSPFGELQRLVIRFELLCRNPVMQRNLSHWIWFAFVTGYVELWRPLDTFFSDFKFEKLESFRVGAYRLCRGSQTICKAVACCELVKNSAQRKATGSKNPKKASFSSEFGQLQMQHSVAETYLAKSFVDLRCRCIVVSLQRWTCHLWLDLRGINSLNQSDVGH